MHEIIIVEIYSVLLGPSRGANINLFERFQQCWPTINQANFAPLDDARLAEPLLQQLRSEVGYFSTFSSLSCQVTLQVHTYHKKTTKR